MKPKVIAIVGPTASGKTRLGIEIAKRWNGEVISVDSRQVYRGMDIGTAKPEGTWVESEIEKDGSIKQLFGSRKTFLVDGVTHWGIDLVTPDEPFSAADFKAYATEKINEIFVRGRLPILVGGTGFWLKTIIDNLDLTSTPGDPALRAELESRTLGDLFHEYKQLDPEGAELIDKQNKRRVVRALEVTKLTGKPWSEQQTAGEQLYDVLQIGLLLPREELIERIDSRVEEMVARGLVDEVRRFKDTYGCECESMTGIGYRQVCAFLSDITSLGAVDISGTRSEQLCPIGHNCSLASFADRTKLNAAIEDVKRDTRAYAKRQMTWFKRDSRIVWVNLGDSTENLIKRFLENRSNT
ncbi:tRNA (adenosine(37)-N6)-dimethylallyltransferase MiaA [Candidatus Uhrbacteria bacterium]|nr:tRNA (adenosine(37)-N6)-dimethylallyltransferase MiaA [Candidatus Uhrbacteria bacterium]